MSCPLGINTVEPGLVGVLRAAYCRLAATDFVGSAFVADLGMMSAWVPPETGHEGQFYERIAW